MDASMEAAWTLLREPPQVPPDGVAWASPSGARARARPSNLHGAVRASASFPLSQKVATMGRELRVSAERSDRPRMAVQARMTQSTQTEEAVSQEPVGESLRSSAGIRLGAFGEVGKMTEETVDFLIRVLEDRKQELLVSDEGRELHVRADYDSANEADEGSEEASPSPHRRRLPFDTANHRAGDGASVTELVRSHSYEALVQLEGILESRHNELMNNGLLEIPASDGNERYRRA